jgi:hypothetical protein
MYGQIPLRDCVCDDRNSSDKHLSALLVIVVVTRTSLVGTHYIEAGTYALFLALVFAVELAFVHFVQRRVLNDPGFAKQVAAISPKVSMWYAGVSVGLLAASTVAMNLAS